MAMTVKLSPDRKGILVDGEELPGFPYLGEMAETDQLRVAAWARKLAPRSLTAAQRALLENRQPSARRLEGLLQDQILRSPLVRTLWDSLSETQQALVLNPDQELGKRYPLSTGELSRLTGMSKRQVQYWSERRLLPHWLDERGHRHFEAAGVIVAFALSSSKQHDRQHYADVGADSRPLAAMRRAVSVVALSALSSKEKLDPDELERTERTLRLLADELHEAREDPANSRQTTGILT
jgi:DNA-binding transcriptional regulator YiaG